jgi:cytochrome c biogenesis protein CcdA/thiol-disulfide isomerase/thioredoxin
MGRLEKGPRPVSVVSSVISFSSVLLLLVLSTLIPLATAQHPVSVYYFYGADCPHCQAVTPVIEALEAKYPDVVVHKLEIAYNETNAELLNAFIRAYNPPAVDIPAAFIGTTALIGYELTRERLEREIQTCLQNECPDPITFIASPEEPQAPVLAVLIGTALVEGINPCGIAVLIVLLASLLLVRTKRRVLLVGLAFIIAVFGTHLLVGLGIIKVLLLSGVAPIMRAIVIVVVIPAGIINILDFWREKSTLAIPTALKPLLGKLARFASIPGAVLLGSLATLAGLPCTGPLYLTMLDLIADLPAEAVLYLLLYNLFYTLPLVIILLIVYQGIAPEEAEAWRKSTRRYMKLIGGLVMLGIGTGMLAGVV